VLDFARIEEGRQQYQRARIDTTPWLCAIADDFQTIAPEGKTVVATVPDQLPPLVGDRQALGRAIQNLLDNGLKYSPASDRVWLDADSHGGSVVIRIRDEGVGIPVPEQKRIFERFFRGSEVVDLVKGAGLGLSLVRHAVAAHHGTVEVESVPGRGTTFTLRLPAAEQAARS